MKKVKYRFFLDYDKEEKWINEMAEKGWHLEKFASIRFVFKKDELGKYIYRNEFIGGLSKKEKEDYFELLKDSGVTIVHECFCWVYLKKPKAEGDFELYTDTSSKIDYFNRILNIFFVLYLLNIAFAAFNISFSFKSEMKYVNIITALINLFAMVILFISMFKINKQKRKLQQIQQFFE